jgi:cytochrome b561
MPQFTLLSRLLHWTMAAMILTMLFIGVSMVSSLADYHALVSIHRPLGIAILILVVIRYVNRRLNPPPPFLDTMPPLERRVASASELFLYTLMFLMPLVGWGMLSAARYPIVLFGSWHLPPILPHSPSIYAVLRKLHTVLAYLLFFTFLGHITGVMFHQLILQDGILNRMALWRVRTQK